MTGRRRPAGVWRHRAERGLLFRASGSFSSCRSSSWLVSFLSERALYWLGPVRRDFAWARWVSSFRSWDDGAVSDGSGESTLERMAARAHAAWGAWAARGVVA